jgi:hypothetical protein
VKPLTRLTPSKFGYCNHHNHPVTATMFFEKCRHTNCKHRVYPNQHPQEGMTNKNGIPVLGVKRRWNHG